MTLFSYQMTTEFPSQIFHIMPFSIIFRAASKLDQAKEGVPPFLASIKLLLGKEIPFHICAQKASGSLINRHPWRANIAKLKHSNSLN